MKKADLDRLPKHARDEIKKNPNQERFWQRWADVGAAKETERKAFAGLVDAQQDYADCRLKAQRKDPTRSLGPNECGCGRHAAPLLAAFEASQQARAAIPPTVAAFKEG